MKTWFVFVLLYQDREGGRDVVNQDQNQNHLRWFSSEFHKLLRIIQGAPPPSHQKGIICWGGQLSLYLYICLHSFVSILCFSPVSLSYRRSSSCRSCAGRAGRSVQCLFVFCCTLSVLRGTAAANTNHRERWAFAVRWRVIRCYVSTERCSVLTQFLPLFSRSPAGDRRPWCFRPLCVLENSAQISG